MKRTRSVSQRLANSTNDQENSASVNSLPLELMMRIFQYLSHKERLRVEAVCKKWRECSQATWRTVKTLRLSHSSKTNLLTVSGNSVHLTTHDKVVKKIMSLCETVNDLLLEDDFNFFPRYIYAGFGKIFCNLRKLEVVGSEKSVLTLSSLFKKNIQMDSVSMELNEKHQKLMKYLPRTLRELNILAYREYDVEEYLRVLTDLPALRCLDTPVDETILDVIGTLDKLTSLTVWENELIFSGSDLLSITKLCNLEYLNMIGVGCFVTDEFLIQLSEKCRKIRQLHIDRRKHVPCAANVIFIPPRPRDLVNRRGAITKHGLNAVSSLPELRELDICDKEAMCDEVLLTLTNLQKIKVSGCYKLTNSGVIQYIESNKNLEELVMKFFEQGKVEKILPAVVEVIEERKGEQVKVLTVVVDDSCEESTLAFRDKSKYLKVKVG